VALGVLSTLASSVVVVGGAGAAMAAPVYEIEGQWVDPPATIARGNPVVAEWRINVNDDQAAPSNDPVDNVTATFTLDKAFFDEIPDLCLTADVDPPSSISADGRSLTCNFGTVNMGTALVVQTPVVADGITGEEVALSGTGPDGQIVDLPKIPIRNPFVMDLHLGGNTNFENWDDVSNPTYVDADVQWSLRLGKGSDPGPANVTYRVRVTDVNGRPVRVGTHPRQGVQGCTTFDMANADGHPWSHLPPDHPQTHRGANFVDECILAPVAGQPGVFTLTLRGINYDLLNAPTHDANAGGGNPLPTNWNYIASGSMWFRVLTSQAGSIDVRVDPVTYQAPTGQEYTDLAGNNRTNKTYTLPGSFSAAWRRAYTQSGGTSWDDTYRVSPGTTVQQVVNNGFSTDNVGANAQYGNCLVFDTDYVTYEPDAPIQLWAIDPGSTRPWIPIDLSTVTVEYYTGNVPDPNSFNCGTGQQNWTTTEPANPADVKAVRVRYPFSTFSDMGSTHISFWAHTTIKPDVQVGQDVWMFGSVLRNGDWGVGIGEPWDSHVITATPGARYPATNGRRDILRIVSAVPYIEKAAARSTVTPGVPADFTLTYAATGSGIIPETVDGVVIRDVLPLGMTYEPDSADPPPVVSTDAQGRQVLTWTLDGVATNVEHTLTYQATADSSIAPGTQLTNTATASYGGETTEPVTETVTTTTNGFTTILKTSDVEFIPNRNGDGVGTGSWTVAIESVDPLPQAFTDTIDVLPYNGDQRGTSYSGTYTLDEVVLPDGGTVYYTTADPTTLSDDPADPMNGAAGTITGNTVGWTTTKPDNPTAIRVIGPELPPGGTFSFQIPITTDSAEPQDVYVNRAQARAEHTELVMRTSAPLVVTDYLVEKASNPPSGTTLYPGDVVEYTITVTQQGPVPAGALLTDTITDVLDDATYNEDLAADIGTATLDGDVISWEGTIPVGEVAHITYSVTVKDIEGLASEGSTFLNNQVESPGCDEPDNCETEHPVGYYEYSKTSDPTPGSTVQVDDVVTYTVTIVQQGEGAVTDARVTDDLSAVFDDATWNNDLQASAGQATLDGSTLAWTGDLAVGQVVILTYSVTVNADNDYTLVNVVTSDDHRSRCVPAADGNPDCTTDHYVGDYEVVKTSDPTSGSEVEPGDVVTYTVVVRHFGVAEVAQASFEDDLSRVLDDATWNGGAEATAGEVSYTQPTLSWSGPLALGDVVTVTYAVTVTAEGDRFLKNVVTTDGQCVPAEGRGDDPRTEAQPVDGADPLAAGACTTEHINGAYTYSKTSDPVPGAEVTEGEVITYTVTVAHVGTAPVEDAVVTDDLSGVLAVASWNGDATASSGQVSTSGDQLTWTGDLEVEQVVTVTYSVTVGGAPQATIHNVVTSPDERGVCVPAADGNPDCQTAHHTPAEPVLPRTGMGMVALLFTGLVLLAGGLVLLVLAMRRRSRGLTG
jgi:uncharacterized repeat protein (TIGR01451 family)